MASSSAAAATSDTLVTLKVQLDGAPRRFKLPLRDLGANTLEDKLRCHLQIPVTKVVTVERYSDSAASYVALNQQNIAVYKQLFRAAKAKQKLKLRITTKSVQLLAPKPATVEDELDAESTRAIGSTSHAISPALTPTVAPRSEAPAASPAATLETITAPQNPEEFPEFIKHWRARGMPRIHLRHNTDGVEVVDFVGSVSQSAPLVTLAPVDGTASQDSTSPSSDQYRFSQTASELSLSSLIRDAHQKEEAGAAEAMVKQLAQSTAKSTDFQSNMAPKTVERKPVEECAKGKAKEDVPAASNSPSCLKRPFTVCCNSCDRAVPSAHFHCSICDDGDFDLCQDCVTRGITCYGEGHWLIKRTIADGQIKCSTTHIAPKLDRPAGTNSTPPSTSAAASAFSLPLRPAERSVPSPSSTAFSAALNARTCNCCVQEFPEQEFVHCNTCDDFDLCKGCFVKDSHGHDPKHGFAPAVSGTVFPQAISSRLAPGRNVVHNAICDGCNQYVRGIRHKCLDCPDWDYCSECMESASFVHPGHRFVPVLEPLGDRVFRSLSRATHFGICCDGPLCSAPHSGSKYIIGERYKCAVCHDTDFCANCEASPANNHNKTHPLIKFKSPVRHVSVTTTGEHEDGKRLPTMGDQTRRARIGPCESIAATPVQTVVDVQPTEQQSATNSKAAEHSVSSDLVAIFKRDTVADGTVMPPNHIFQQTWVLRNEGTTPWPAGCSVKFVGGDYMGSIDPAHPAGIHELVSASESTIRYNTLSPGQEFPFTVLLRTPDRDGKVISYWRLTTPDGVKFGHKLWCDVLVRTPPSKPSVVQTPLTEQAKVTTPVASPVVVPAAAPPAPFVAPAIAPVAAPVVSPEMTKSQMIIPKLVHENIHEDRSEVTIETSTETESVAPSASVHDSQEDDDFEDCGEDEDWAEDSDHGFLTDEEYDILDASDEEYLSEQQHMLARK
ncbi:Uu.00g102220.m01.CDS01 [Anthostomella pinea]|uniref:Uu.00g102220.m01.CDS01 n=1 Tax=Anthostomella pinea TaxID=933095 RepID=A0AAI8VE06_9PEZI|nr:Uu.00g102220.m01.CDS01 [Anthostomella pinea]